MINPHELDIRANLHLQGHVRDIYLHLLERGDWTQRSALERALPGVPVGGGYLTRLRRAGLLEVKRDPNKPSNPRAYVYRALRTPLETPQPDLVKRPPKPEAETQPPEEPQPSAEDPTLNLLEEALQHLSHLTHLLHALHTHLKQRPTEEDLLLTALEQFVTARRNPGD